MLFDQVCRAIERHHFYAKEITPGLHALCLFDVDKKIQKIIDRCGKNCQKIQRF